MIVAILKETIPGENRVAAIPATIKEMIKQGMTIKVETNAGEGSYISDNDYQAAGAEIVSDRSVFLPSIDLVLKVAPATLDEIDSFKDGLIYISLFQTTSSLEQVKKLKEKNITAFSMHLIPPDDIGTKHGCFEFPKATFLVTNLY